MIGSALSAGQARMRGSARRAAGLARGAARTIPSPGAARDGFGPRPGGNRSPCASTSGFSAACRCVGCRREEKDSRSAPRPSDTSAASSACSWRRRLILAVLGFLGYYLPVYAAPHRFPSATVALPLLGPGARAVGQLGWAVLLTTIELFVLTLLNMVGVHEIAVATGFLTADTKPGRMPDLLSIGLERKTTEVTRYGIDPFEGLHPWMLFLFNLVLRLKGWLANQAVRYLVRLLLGRYARARAARLRGRAALHGDQRVRGARRAPGSQGGPDGARGDPRPREARVGMDPSQVEHDARLRHAPVHRGEQARFPPEPLPPDARAAGSLARARRASAPAAGGLPRASRRRRRTPRRTLCQALILSGFVLDGQLSWRELRRLDAMQRPAFSTDRPADVRRRLRQFLAGGGLPLDRLLEVTDSVQVEVDAHPDVLDLVPVELSVRRVSVEVLRQELDLPVEDRYLLELDAGPH